MGVFPRKQAPQPGGSRLARLVRYGSGRRQKGRPDLADGLRRRAFWCWLLRRKTGRTGFGRWPTRRLVRGRRGRYRGWSCAVSARPFLAHWPTTPSISRSCPARSTRCSARTAPASRPWSRSSTGSCGPMPARSSGTAARLRFIARRRRGRWASAWSSSTFHCSRR